MANTKIAFVGPWGCGKTVLLTVLTHRFEHPTPEGYQIRPSNQEAANFCIEKWGYLERGDWPSPTQVVERPPVYRWELCRRSGKNEILTSDIAGEAWRTFIDKSVNDSEKESVRPAWQKIKAALEAVPAKFSQSVINQHITSMENLLKDASAVYLLLDLSQIINMDQGYELAAFLPTALVQHMRSIGRTHVPITLVLTKADKYKFKCEEKGSWQEVVEECIPWIPKFKKILPVSAVADIQKGLPKHGFKSEGLKELFEDIWENTEEGRLRELLHSLKRFCIIDVPVLFALYLIYQFICYMSSQVWLCHVFFWLCVVIYCGIKITLFMNKKR